MADIVTNEEVDAEVERVNDLRQALADAEAAKVAAIRAADNAEVLAGLKVEADRLQDAIDELDDEPAPAPVPVTPPTHDTPPAPSFSSSGLNAGGK